MKKRPNIYRFNLELSTDDRRFLDKATKSLHSASLTETIRRALRLAVVIIKFQKGGRAVILRGKDGKEAELIIS